MGVPLLRVPGISLSWSKAPLFPGGLQCFWKKRVLAPKKGRKENQVWHEESEGKKNYCLTPPPRKLTSQWKIHHLKMNFLLNIGVFPASHDSFQGCISGRNPCSKTRHEGRWLSHVAGHSKKLRWPIFPYAPIPSASGFGLWVLGA